jgi:glycosyltransferase involved in cell wall biosynthesis
MIDIGGIAATRISWLYMPQHKISVIINNYNYAQFLRECIDSALAQTYLGVEVIAVDDGSKDDSANIIKGYGSKVMPVLKENGGQGSAFNAGYAASTGDIVLFLDADDVLLPDTIQQCSLLFDIPDVVKVHWPLYFIDKRGNRTGEIKEPILPEGDFRQIVHRQGPMAEQLLPSAPTSGNAYRRQFLHKVLPMPEEPYRISADAYLFGLAPAFGIIRRASKPLGLYRAHGTNTYRATDFLRKVKNGVRDYEQQSAVLSRILRQDDVDLDTSGWGSRAAVRLGNWLASYWATTAGHSRPLPPAQNMAPRLEDYRARVRRCCKAVARVIHRTAGSGAPSGRTLLRCSAWLGAT